MANEKLLRVDEDTHNKVVKIAASLQSEKGEMITVGEAVAEIVRFYLEKHGGNGT